MTATGGGVRSFLRMQGLTSYNRPNVPVRPRIIVLIGILTTKIIYRITAKRMRMEE